MITLPPKISGYRSREINTLSEAVGELRPQSSNTIKVNQMTGGGLELKANIRDYGPRFDMYNFGYYIYGTKITVLAGSVFLFGVGTYDIAETEITLSGTTDYVYIQHPVTHASAGTITHSATKPSSTDPTYWNFLLYTCTAFAGGTTYSVKINHIGDVFIGAAI